MFTSPLIIDLDNSPHLSVYHKLYWYGQENLNLDHIIIIYFVCFNLQIFLFATELFSVVNFLDDSEDTFSHLFLLNPNESDYSIYTKNQFYLQARHSVEQVSQ